MDISIEYIAVIKYLDGNVSLDFMELKGLPDPEVNDFFTYVFLDHEVSLTLGRLGAVETNKSK